MQANVIKQMDAEMTCINRDAMAVDSSSSDKGDGEKGNLCGVPSRNIEE